MEAREIKALQIAATMPLKRTTYGWQVPSQTGNGAYTVASTNPDMARMDMVSGLACTCPDYETRGLPCKHVMAVEYTIKREVTPEGEIVSESIKVTYGQDWTAYDKAQCEEKDRLLPMLADLCSTIPQPSQGRGRPRLPMSDMAFAAISKVYGGRSARRSDSDVRENASRGLTTQDPHFNSVLRYLRDPEMTPVLKALVELSALPLKGVEDDFAIDSTGFSTCRFVRWYDHKWGKEMTKREWVKLHAMTGVRTNIVTSVEMTDYRGADSPQFKPLVETTSENFALRNVTADKAYSSKKNHQIVADAGGTPYIPFKSDIANRVPIHDPEATLPGIGLSAWTRMFHMFAFQRDTFLSRYHQRSNVETTFSMIKAKFGDSCGASPTPGR
jgi:transposase